jgi:pilus assembly protein Flp/PilA
MEDRPTATADHLEGKNDRGASLVEYALLLALIVVVCVGAVTFFGGSLDDSFSRSGSSIVAASSG